MTKKPKLCNMTYTNEHGVQRLCQDGTARPAIRQRLGARVCAECWPELRAKMAETYGMGSGFALAAVDRAFSRVR